MGKGKITYEPRYPFSSKNSDKTVLVDGEIIGWLTVVKNGWMQHDLKRGTPSQRWNFTPDPSANLKVHYQWSRPYLKEIKEIIEKRILEKLQ